MERSGALERDFQGASFLKAPPTSRLPKEGGRAWVWVPAWAHYVVLTYLGEPRLNLFQHVTLALAQGDVSSAAGVSALTHLQKDVVVRVQDELRSDGWLTGAGRLSTDGRELLRDPSRLRDTVSVVGVMYVDAVRGQTVPAFVLPLDHRFTFALGEGEGPESGDTGPLRPRVPAQWDEAAGVQALLSVYRDGARGGNLGAGHRLPPPREMEGASVVRLGRAPEPCWLRTSLYFPRPARRSEDFLVRAPFALRPDPSLKALLLDAMDDDSDLAKHLSTHAGRIAAARTPEDHEVRAVYARHDHAVNELSRRVGGGLADDPDVQRYLFNAVAGREMARLFESWTHWDAANNSWGAMSFYEPAVVNAARACEALFNRLWATMPFQGVTPGEARPPVPLDKKGEQEVRGKNMDLLVATAQAVGFHTFTKGMSFSMANTLASYAQKELPSLKKPGLVSLVLFTLLAASQRADHPFRRFAEEQPGGLGDLLTLASEYRNPASHGNSASRTLTFAEAERGIETAITLAAHVYH